MNTPNFSEDNEVEQVIKAPPPFLIMNGSFLVALIITVFITFLSLYPVEGTTVHEGILYQNQSKGTTELKLNILENQITTMKTASRITVRRFSDNLEIATINSASIYYIEGNASLTLILSKDALNYINRSIWEDETIAVKISFKTPAEAIYKKLNK